MKLATLSNATPDGRLHVVSRDHARAAPAEAAHTLQQALENWGNVEAALAPILHGFRWLGIDWDEGPEVGGPHAPYYQSQRLPRYQAAAEKLLGRPCDPLDPDLIVRVEDG